MTTRPPAGPVLRSTVAGLASRSIAVFLHGLLGVATLSLLSRLLRPEDFGLLGMANVVLGFATIFSQLGVSPAIIQRAELRPEHVRVAFTISIAAGLAMAALTWALAPLLAHVFREPEVTGVTRGLSPTFAIAGTGVVAHALAERRLDYALLMRVDLTGQAVGSLLTAVVLAALGFGVWSLVAGTWVHHLVRVAMLWRLERHPRRPLLAAQPARELARLGGGFTLSRVLHYTANQGDTLVVGRALGADSLGIYSRAYRLMMLPVTYFSGVLSRVLFPTVARLQTSPARLREIYLGGSAVVALVATPLSVLLLIAAPEIVRVLLGPGWERVTDPFRVLAAGILFRAAYPIGDALARGLGRMYQRSARDALYAALVVAGAWAGLRFGLPGVAAGVLGAVVVNYLTAASMSLPAIGATWRDYARSQAPGLLLACIVAVAALPVRLALRPLVPVLPLLLLTLAAGGLAALAALAVRPAIVGEHGLASLRALLRAVDDRRLPRGLAQRLDRLTRRAQA